MEHINWYPGHMKKTEERMSENLKLVDVVCELLDARIPYSSRNPNISKRTENKPRIIILNKQDLADPGITKLWETYLLRETKYVLALNSQSGTGVKALKTTLERIRDERNKQSKRRRPLRLMIVGVPNVGKSSLINRLVGKKGAKTGNKPGVTRGEQWLSLGRDIQLLDTPGVLWPKFEEPDTGRNLAYCGIIKDEILDIQQLAITFIELLVAQYPDCLPLRYGIDQSQITPVSIMESIAKSRGHILYGGIVDYERTARTVLDEFRRGLLGRITLERP